MTDPLARALAANRETLKHGNFAELSGAVARMSAALTAVMELHRLRWRIVYGITCPAHSPGVPVSGCPVCRQGTEREVRAECRDQFGDPVAIGGCRVRAAVLIALTREDRP